MAVFQFNSTHAVQLNQSLYVAPVNFTTLKISNVSDDANTDGRNFNESVVLTQFRDRHGYDATWIKHRETSYKNQFQKRLPFIVVTLAVVKILCFIYLGKTNYYNRPLDVDISWLRNLNRRSMFWRYQEERDRLRPPPASPRRASRLSCSGGGGGSGCDRGRRRTSEDVNQTPTSSSSPIDIPPMASLPRHQSSNRSGGGDSYNAAAEPTVVLIGGSGRSASSRRSCSSERRHRRRRDRPRNRHSSLTDHGRGGRIVPTSTSSLSTSPAPRDHHHHHHHHQHRASHQHLRVPGGGGTGNHRRRRRGSRSPTRVEEGRGEARGRGGGCDLPSYNEVITTTSPMSSTTTSRFPYEGKTSWESFPPPPTYQEAVCLGSAESPTDARWHVGFAGGGGGGGEGGGGVEGGGEGREWVQTPPEVVIIGSPTDSVAHHIGFEMESSTTRSSATPSPSPSSRITPSCHPSSSSSRNNTPSHQIISPSPTTPPTSPPLTSPPPLAANSTSSPPAAAAPTHTALPGARHEAPTATTPTSLTASHPSSSAALSPPSSPFLPASSHPLDRRDSQRRLSSSIVEPEVTDSPLDARTSPLARLPTTTSGADTSTSTTASSQRVAAALNRRTPPPSYGAVDCAVNMPPEISNSSSTTQTYPPQLPTYDEAMAQLN